MEHESYECSAMVRYPTDAEENTALLKMVVDTMPVIFVDRPPARN
jgi:hypothetical protein